LFSTLATTHIPSSEGSVRAEDHHDDTTSTMPKPTEYYRADGVRITHDPFAPEMVEKYGAPGKTDNEGFDPYADTVGPGIYGGRVERDRATGEVVMGQQYQNHNPRPGPVYAGGGYTPVADALRERDSAKPTLRKMLNKYKDLANDVSTGGALPLHLCGMSREAQDAVPVLVEFGADVEALDTYGMTPLHRMASNNLNVGARMLLEAGADADFRGSVGATPLQIAQDSRAGRVLEVLQEFGSRGKQRRSGGVGRGSSADVVVTKIDVMAHPSALAGNHVGGKEAEGRDGAAAGGDDEFQIAGEYLRTPAAAMVPPGFARVCEAQGWNTEQMWKKLNAGADWFRNERTEAYVYFNQADKCWWIDAPGGEGVWKTPGHPNAVPAHGWKPLQQSRNNKMVAPMVRSFRGRFGAAEGRSEL